VRGRSLTLKRERLAELTQDELLSVNGGNRITLDGVTCPVLTCVSPDPQSLVKVDTCHCCTASDSCA
jgi:hypothetical protein